MESLVRATKPFLFRKVIVLSLFLFFGAWGVADAAKREIHTLVLKNGLSVFLVSDPDVHRSATGLAVGTGSLYDPLDKMGLAHYLEHMLFLGTKKYPDVESFKKYLNENSGASNAYTADNITNYFFQSSHESFVGALDRFSQFFKEPLFDKKYAEREVNAVSSEHDKNKLDDGWRANYIRDQIAEPGHPLARFATGNKETLAGDNRPALLKFYKKYYSASNMKLAMISNLSLNEQTLLVKKYFETIPGFPVSPPRIDPQFRKPLKDQYRFLKIKTIKDIRHLILEFPTIRLIDRQDGKPANLIGSLIGHEGKGSLLSKLKEEGLALGLSAGAGYGHPDINSFDINISLTREGVKRYERVLELVFSYIKLLREHGIEEYTFKEEQTMSQINFDWKDPQEGMGYAAGIAALMHSYKLEDVETLPYLYKKFDPEACKAVLDTLTPENMLATVQVNDAPADKKDKFYQAEYSISQVGGEAFRKLKDVPVINGLSYPVKNDFIPENLTMAEEEPHLARNDDIAKIWFKFDERFHQPKVYMSLRIETPLTYDTVTHNALSQLYTAAVLEGLNEKVYPIQLAGLSYALSAVKEGVVLTVGGYSERISDLVKLVAANLVELKIDDKKFKDLKEAIVLGLENRKLSQAYARGSYYASLMLLEKQYDEDDLIDAFAPLTLNDLREYGKKMYERVFVTGMVHGNWPEKKALESVQTLLDAMASRPLPEKDRFKQVVRVLDPGEKVQFSKKVEDQNNSLAYIMQVGKREFDLQAKVLMAASVVESDFFTQMRTNQQLGYVVWSFPLRFEDRLFFEFVIQSATFGPFEIKQRVETWLAKSGDIFDALSDEEFEKHRAGLVVSLEKKGDSIAEAAGELFYFATEEKGDFQRKKKLVRTVKGLKKEDLKEFARTLFQSPDSPRLAILIRAKNNEEPVPQGVLGEVSQFTARKNRQAMR
ncbi:MAG: insulinase family protein [Nitrospinae bacterium]|nr:insulinase family protein [Nitrospinota bacterium]